MFERNDDAPIDNQFSDRGAHLMLQDAREKMTPLSEKLKQKHPLTDQEFDVMDRAMDQYERSLNKERDHLAQKDDLTPNEQKRHAVLQSGEMQIHLGHAKDVFRQQHQDHKTSQTVGQQRELHGKQQSQHNQQQQDFQKRQEGHEEKAEKIAERRKKLEKARQNAAKLEQVKDPGLYLVLMVLDMVANQMDGSSILKKQEKQLNQEGKALKKEQGLLSQNEKALENRGKELNKMGGTRISAADLASAQKSMGVLGDWANKNNEEASAAVGRDRSQSANPPSRQKRGSISVP